MGNFLQSIIDRDPAAKSKISLILNYNDYINFSLNSTIKIIWVIFYNL